VQSEEYGPCNVALRTLAGATELPWANGRITCALGWIERNMWRGTFFKRFCQIGQLGGDAIPVV
jgi:hypothetical protein